MDRVLVAPFERLPGAAVRTRDEVLAHVAGKPFLLDPALALDRRSRADDDDPIPEGLAALDTEADLVAFSASALHCVAVHLIEQHHAHRDASEARRRVRADQLEA